MNMEQEVMTDMLGNQLNIGDIVLVLVPKTDASYRKAVIRDMCWDTYRGKIVYVEYDDGRLYCNTKWFYIDEAKEIKFVSKPVKVWRRSDEMIKFDAKYFD